MEAATPGDTVIIAEVFTKEGREEEMAQVLREHTEHTLEEPGILLFAVHRDREDPTHFVVVEVYESQDALEVHRGTARYQDLMAFIPELIRDRGRVELEPLPAGDPKRSRLA